MLLGYWSTSCLLLCFHKGKEAFLYSPPKTHLGVEDAVVTQHSSRLKHKPNINQITCFFLLLSCLFGSSIGRTKKTTHKHTHKKATAEQKMIEKHEKKLFPPNWEFRNKSSSKIIMREIWHSKLVNWNQVLQSLCFHSLRQTPSLLPCLYANVITCTADRCTSFLLNVWAAEIIFTFHLSVRILVTKWPPTTVLINKDNQRVQCNFFLL